LERLQPPLEPRMVCRRRLRVAAARVAIVAAEALLQPRLRT